MTVLPSHKRYMIGHKDNIDQTNNLLQIPLPGLAAFLGRLPDVHIVRVTAELMVVEMSEELASSLKGFLSDHLTIEEDAELSLM